MSAKIACPNCGHDMSLKTPKAGRFKPTCTSCKKAFALVIEEGDPPKFKVGKIAEGASAIAPSSKAPSTKAPSSKEAQTKEPLRQSSTSSSIHEPVKIEATIDSELTQVAPKVSSKLSSEELIRENKPHPSADETIDQEASEPEPVPPKLARPSPVERRPVRSPERTVDFEATQVATPSSADVTVDQPTRVATPSAIDPATTGEFSLEQSRKTAAPGGKTRIESKASGNEAVPDRLGGYRILKELGRGGMGAVYLAKQLSLDRKVALKTIQAAWASNPRVIARFIREAYAAAQLTHHNVVQIYDLGQERGTNFFSMELVSGGSLDELLAEKGKIEPRTAALYILQAARGLKFAHDHGMVHRDVKPANLMLTSDSLVKVADLGLVKTPSTSDDEETLEEDRNVMLASARSHVTGIGSTMGTPAYMSPEQADDAANVDHRADIYSLGCTFYALLTGRPPFSSNSALEVITKHKTAKIERPDKIIVGIPSEVGTIVERMTAKLPGDRYQDLSEVIQDLEQFLAGGDNKPFSPTKEHADILESASKEFHQAPAARLRTLMPPLALVSLLAIALLGVFFSLRFSSAVLVAAIATPIMAAILAAIREGSSPVGSRLRATIMSSTLSDWVTWGIGSIFAMVVAYTLGLIGWWIGGLAFASLLAFAFHWFVSGSLNKQRNGAVLRVEHLLKELRLAGMDEIRIQRFVAEFSGKHWEELFEKMFDYDTMRQARSSLFAEGKLKGRHRHQPWRDWIIDRLETRVQQARQAREQKVLAGVEQANLKAKGIGAAEAKQQAEEFAASMVHIAAENRQGTILMTMSSQESAAEKRERIKGMLQAARTGKPKSMGSLASRTTGALLGHLLGGKLRFAIGALLVMGCILWANQNQLFDSKQFQDLKTEIAKQDITKADVSSLAGSGQQLQKEVQRKLSETKPLQFPIVGKLFNSFAPGCMGLLILLSSLVTGWRYSLFAIPAAAVTLFGPTLGVPTFFVPASWIGFIAGLILLGIGLLLGRQKR